MLLSLLLWINSKLDCREILPERLLGWRNQTNSEFSMKNLFELKIKILKIQMLNTQILKFIQPIND